MADIYEEIVRLRRSGRPGALVTLIARSGSAPMAENAKMLVADRGTTFGTVGGGALEARLVERALEVMATERATTASFDLSEEADASLGMLCGGKVEFLLEPVSTAPEVLIVGAGHVGKELARVLSATSFRVTVMDDRPELLAPERLGGARTVAGDLAATFAAATPGPRSLVVVATRSHDLDLEAVRRALGSEAMYVGLLGSTKKAEKFRAVLTADGATGLERLRCPVGLAIGADDPAEIALSIAAELVAVRRGAASSATSVP